MLEGYTIFSATREVDRICTAISCVDSDLEGRHPVIARCDGSFFSSSLLIVESDRSIFPTKALTLVRLQRGRKEEWEVIANSALVSHTCPGPPRSPLKKLTKNLATYNATFTICKVNQTSIHYLVPCLSPKKIHVTRLRLVYLFLRSFEICFSSQDAQPGCTTRMHRGHRKHRLGLRLGTRQLSPLLQRLELHRTLINRRRLFVAHRKR
jgi:hypothetical protein